MNDSSPMPWGKHAGTQMADVPPDYLLWLYENGKAHNDVKRYIEDNLDVIKAQIAYKKKSKI